MIERRVLPQRRHAPLTLEVIRIFVPLLSRLCHHGLVQGYLVREARRGIALSVLLFIFICITCKLLNL